MDRRGGKEGADGAEGSGAEISQRDGDTEDCEGGALHDVVTIRGHQGDVVESGLGEGASEAEEHAWEVTGGCWRGREEGGTGAARGEGDALRDSKDSSERKGWRERSSFPVASRGPAGRPRSIRRKVRPSRRSRGGPWNTAPKAICGGRWGTVRGGGLTSGADGCTGIWRGVRTRPRGAGKGGRGGKVQWGGEMAEARGCCECRNRRCGGAGGEEGGGGGDAHGGTRWSWIRRNLRVGARGGVRQGGEWRVGWEQETEMTGQS